MDKSPVGLQPYMVYRGIAAEDIEKDSTILLVICPELMPNAPFGEIGSGISQESNILQNRDGKVISSNVTSANHIVATWEGASNQRYPPLIRKGEPVELYRTEGQDKYRWRSTGNGRDLRTTDRVHVEVGALGANQSNTQKDDTNTYSAYLDSANKVAGLKTSKANGEVAAFSMEANLAEGTFHISDDSKDVANRIFLDTGAKSGTPMFQVNLSTGTTLKFEGKNVFLKVPGGFFVDVGDRYIVNSPISIFNTSKKGTVIINAANLVLNSARDIILAAGGVLGLNSIAAKITGVLVAGTARIANATKGPEGSAYKGASVSDPLKSPVTDHTNTPDATPSPLPYRTL